MPELSDDILLDKSRREENDSYSLLYKKYFPSIANYIEQNSGNDQDAEDIFQESIIVLLGKVRQSDFNLTASLKTYLFSIAKNLWLKQIKSHRNSLIQNAPIDIVAIYLDDAPTQNDKESKLSTWLGKITANCQRILKAIFLLNEPMDSLMTKMGWKNKHTASNQKYKCIEQVRKESKNNP